MNNYTVWALFGPETWPFWLLLVAALHFLGRDRRGSRYRRGGRFVFAALTAAILLGVLPLGSWLIRPLEARFPPSRLDRAPGTIVVLAGSEALGSSEWRRSLELNDAGERVLDGAALANRFPRAKLAIAGGVFLEGTALSDVGLTSDAWQRLGIAPGRIVRIDRTKDTCANATGVNALRLPRPILLVTSAAHMPRSVACFRAAGIEPLVYPVDYRAIAPGRSILGYTQNIQRADFALHEWIGLAYYRLRGRTSELLPSPR